MNTKKIKTALISIISCFVTITLLLILSMVIGIINNEDYKIIYITFLLQVILYHVAFKSSK